MTGRMKKIKVMIVISNLEYGGAQRQVVELSNNIDKERFNLSICVLSPYTPMRQELIDGENGFFVVEKKAKFDLTVATRLAKILKQQAIDIVHGYLFDAEIAVRLAGKLAGTRIILGSERNCYHRYGGHQLLAYKITRNWVDWIVANSRAGAAFNRSLLGYDDERYRVVHNGVNMDKFKPVENKIEAKQKNGIGDEPVIGMFASFKKQKRHDTFFLAANEVLKKIPNIKLLLVGDVLFQAKEGSDEYKNSIMELVDRLGLRDNCLFLGNQDNVEELYNLCDLTVLPSEYEGTPNVILESMSCGVPVIASDVADNSLVIEDGKSGHLFTLNEYEELAEKWIELLENESRRNQMAKDARARIFEEFSTQKLAEKTEAMYQEFYSLKK
ncbi:glycosyl transferase [bacterium endosymbiont of Escarpia laminata]|nr:MAG: glycosyl transferase [bacterium endosymbiont of Escarpia laminata]